METICEESSNSIFGFLDGDMGCARQAVEHLSRCGACSRALETHALIARYRRLPDGCPDAFYIAELSPEDVVRERHLAECAACRLDWLLSQAEFPSPMPVPIRERVKNAVRKVIEWRVLVPALGMAVVVAIVGYMAGLDKSPSSAFPYGTWSGAAETLASLECEEQQWLAFTGISPTGKPLTQNVKDRLSSFQFGWSVALMRDLVAAGRVQEADIVRSAYSLRWSSRIELPSNQALVAGKDPCVFGAIPVPDMCRVGIDAYGWVRDNADPQKSPSSLEAFMQLSADLTINPPEDFTPERVREIAKVLACR